MLYEVKVQGRAKEKDRQIAIILHTYEYHSFSVWIGLNFGLNIQIVQSNDGIETHPSFIPTICQTRFVQKGPETIEHSSKRQITLHQDCLF